MISAAARFMQSLAAISLSAAMFCAIMPQGSAARSGKRAAGLIALAYSIQAFFNMFGGQL